MGELRKATIYKTYKSEARAQSSLLKSDRGDPALCSYPERGLRDQAGSCKKNCEDPTKIQNYESRSSDFGSQSICYVYCCSQNPFSEMEMFELEIIMSYPYSWLLSSRHDANAMAADIFSLPRP
ncbi:hypothetical protein NL676_011843 [Syzygium grande]|nr:hypothetical protein NL676_011843 [Syzygium grande]